jgi:hypothetical protein
VTLETECGCRACRVAMVTCHCVPTRVRNGERQVALLRCARCERADCTYGRARCGPQVLEGRLS